MTAERIDFEADPAIVSSDPGYDDLVPANDSAIRVKAETGIYEWPVSSEESYDVIQDRKLKRLGEALRAAQAVYADEACGKDGKRHIIIS